MNGADDKGESHTFCSLLKWKCLTDGKLVGVVWTKQEYDVKYKKKWARAEYDSRRGTGSNASAEN